MDRADPMTMTPAEIKALADRCADYAHPHEEVGISYMRATLDEAATALRSFMDGGWRPIETAPRGGDEFQAWWRGTWQPRARFDPEYGSFQLWGRTDYDTEGWEVFPIDGYWMPVPTPPAEGEAGE